MKYQHWPTSQTVVNAEVDMVVPAANYQNTQKFRLALDMDTLVDIQDSKEPGEGDTDPAEPEQPNPEQPAPEEPEQPTPNPEDGAGQRFYWQATFINKPSLN